MQSAMSPTLRCLAGLLTVGCPGAAAQAACPIELAVYGDAQSGSEIDFTPTGTSAAVTNSFRLILDNDVVLDGIAMWTDGAAARPHGSLMYKCPSGDATGQELAACTLWEGVIYSADENGVVGLLPVEGAEAPQSLVFPALGPSLQMSTVHGGNGFSKLPSDIFIMKGCQE